MQSVVERLSDITNGINREVINNNGEKYIIYTTTMDISDKAIAKLNEVFDDNRGVSLRIIYQGSKAKMESFEGTVLQIYENHSSVHIVGENVQCVLPFSIIEVVSLDDKNLYQKGIAK